MSTFEQTLHPRALDGTFAEKQLSAAEVSLEPEMLPFKDPQALLARVIADETLLDDPSWDTAELKAFESFNAAAHAAGQYRLRQSLTFVFEADDHEGLIVDAYDRREARETAKSELKERYGGRPGALSLVGVFRFDDEAMYSDEARFVERSGDQGRAREILADA